MFKFLKYILQLILAPGAGWAYVRRENPDPQILLHNGLMPLLGVAALTEFLAFVYMRHVTLATVLMRAVADFGAYFISVFIARLIFELYIGKFTIGNPDARRLECFTVLGIGIMVLFQIVTNCVPWNLVLLRFLPVYAVLVLYKGCRFLSVRKNYELKFTGLSAIAVVAVPLVIYYLLILLIP